MRIAWFTPFSKRSAIGRCSKGIVSALAQDATVEIFCFDQDEIHDANVPVRRHASGSMFETATLSRFDLVVYNFGNYLPFHKDIFEVSQRYPGVAILHDFVMHHFFAGYFLEHLKSRDAYVAAVGHAHGKAGVHVAEASLSGDQPPVWESDSVGEFPLFEGAVRRAEGVITHSEFFRRRVEEVFAGPVRRIPLPYSVDTVSATPSKEDLGLRRDKVILLTIGHVNPNKKTTVVIDAIHQLGPRARDLQYVIAGPCDRAYRQRLEERIASAGLAEVVQLTGEISDHALRGYLKHADVCVNLRYPAIEGASASAIEEMLFGKPLVVGNVGFYAELPDDAVVKIDPSSTDQLRAKLDILIRDAALRRRLGRNARQFAEREFRADRYARELLALALEVRRARPLLQVADRIAEECAIMSVGQDTDLVASVSLTLETLFGEA